MTTPGEFPITFIPRTVSDSIDGDNSEKGSCVALQNLIFDPSTPGILECRPGVKQLNVFTLFNNPKVCSIAFILNDIVYGLVGTDRFPGHDEPFAYDIGSDVFLPVSGVTSMNVPFTLATAGDWVPPNMDVVGVNLIVCHAGFTGGGNPYFGWFDITNPDAPVWRAGNTTTNPLFFVPTAVREFNNRAYFAVKNAIVWTDTLSLNVTSSTQVDFIGDSTPITVLAPMPLSTTSQGILQGLIVFKTNFITQVTGDAALNNLATNEIAPELGTDSPRSIAVTANGIYFRAVDGIRLIQLSGILTDPDPDLALPFIYSLYPSRASGAFNNNTYRICVQNKNAPTAPFQEYWYDIKRKGWTGPHTFRQDLALPYKNSFILFSNTFFPSIWQSDVVVGDSDVFEEVGTVFLVDDDGINILVADDGVTPLISDDTGVIDYLVDDDGVTRLMDDDGINFLIAGGVKGKTLEFLYQTVPMTDTNNVYANSMLNSTIEAAIPANGITYVLKSFNEIYTFITQAAIQAPPANAIWGAFIWGKSLWGAIASGLQPRTIKWPVPIVFSRLSLSISGNSSSGFKVGSFHMIYKQLKYLLNNN